MEALKHDVELLIADEYERASDVYGPLHNSDHENYAVLKEEVDEAWEDAVETLSLVNKLWDCVKSKEATVEQKTELLNSIEFMATMAACECIQVAAMAYKGIRTLQERSNP